MKNKMIKKMNENINEKKMINKMITKTIKKWKKYFNNFQCVAGSVFHNSILFLTLPFLQCLFHWSISAVVSGEAFYLLFSPV